MVISNANFATKHRLSRIRHRHLNCFLEAARSRKIGSAALALNISQPAASKTLAELEDILDAKLFDRGGRGGLKLTPTGRVFLRSAGSSIAALKEGLDGIDQARSPGGATLVIGALLGVAAQFMPRAVKEFRETHGAVIRIITAPNNTMLDQLRVGELDLVVGRLARPKDMQGLSFIHLYSEQLVLVVRAGHPLDGAESLDLSVLEQLTMLMPTADGLMRPVIERFLIAHGVGALQDTIEVRSSDFCRQYLRDSDAVWMVSRGVVEHEIEDGTLKLLKIDTRETQGAMGLTVRSDTDPSPTLRMMMDNISRVAAAFPHTLE